MCVGCGWGWGRGGGGVAVTQCCVLAITDGKTRFLRKIFILEYYRSVSQSVNLSLWLSLSLCLCLSVTVSLCLCLSASVSLSLSLCLSVCLSVSVSLPLSLCLCLSLSLTRPLSPPLFCLSSYYRSIKSWFQFLEMGNYRQTTENSSRNATVFWNGKDCWLLELGHSVWNRV